MSETENEKEEARFLVCMRVADCEDVSQLASGSRIRSCTSCGQLVYVSPSGLIASAPAELICISCFQERAAKERDAGEDVHFEELTDAQVEQVARALGRRPTPDELEDTLNRIRRDLCP